MITRDLSEFPETNQFTTQLSRSGSEFFAPPVPRGMLEPGTNRYTIVTAQGPHTTTHPGVTGGRVVMANNYDQSPVARLTRKGG